MAECMRAERVENLEVNGLIARQALLEADAPVVHLTDVKGAFLRGCRAERGSGTFVQVEGEASSNISMIGNDLSLARDPVSLAEDVPTEAVRQTANIVR